MISTSIHSIQFNMSNPVCVSKEVPPHTVTEQLSNNWSHVLLVTPLSMFTPCPNTAIDIMYT